MEKADKENKAVAGSDSYRNSSGKKPKINPNIKIKPQPKSNEKESDAGVRDTKILEKLKDLEKDEEQRKAMQTLEEQKQKISEEISEMAVLADQIYIGKAEGVTSPESKSKAMYELFKTIVKDNQEEYSSMLKQNLETEMYERLQDTVSSNENHEENIIHKLKILIRDLQEKTPKIHSEVQNFIEAQKTWREDKEKEFDLQIAQISKATEESDKNEMKTKYTDLCEYVDTMRKEVEGFKDAREKLIVDRDEKIAELEETKNNKLTESKRNIEEKIQALKTESDRLKKELPQSRKDYSTHKKESKKLVSIIENNNKKKKEYKEVITKLNKDLYDLNKNSSKDSQSLVDAFKANLLEKTDTQATLNKQLTELTAECTLIQEQIDSKQ
jgi:hypothetical protein